MVVEQVAGLNRLRSLVHAIGVDVLVGRVALVLHHQTIGDGVCSGGDIKLRTLPSHIAIHHPLAYRGMKKKAEGSAQRIDQHRAVAIGHGGCRRRDGHGWYRLAVKRDAPRVVDGMR